MRVPYLFQTVFVLFLGQPGVDAFGVAIPANVFSRHRRASSKSQRDESTARNQTQTQKYHRAAGFTSPEWEQDLMLVEEAEEDAIADQLEDPLTHFLILPGFGKGEVDYTVPGSLVSTLSSRYDLHPGVIDPGHIHVLPLQRSDWLNVFTKGMFDPQFWKGDMPPTNPSFAWYLEKVYQEVNHIVSTQVRQSGYKEENVKVVLLGHSAGGWLARAAVGYGLEQCSDACGAGSNVEEEHAHAPVHCGSTWKNMFQWAKREWDLSLRKAPFRRDDKVKQEEVRKQRLALKHITGIVTLGTPHAPPPQDALDITRGALRITHDTFPGAFHHPDIFYITVAGAGLPGVEAEQLDLMLDPSKNARGFAYHSYLLVSGNGTDCGDGVVPTEFAHLQDSNAIEIELNGVTHHSLTCPNSWYGAEGVIDQWLEPVIDVLQCHYLSLKKNNLDATRQQTKKHSTLPFSNVLTGEVLVAQMSNITQVWRIRSWLDIRRCIMQKACFRNS
jgi:hypothetical protein